MGVERIPVNRGDDSGQEAKVERLARKVLAAYAMEGARITRIGGRENTVYQIREAGERFALRICDPDRDRKGLMRELLWLMALRRDTAIIVPEPLMAMDGEILRTVTAPGISGFHPCMLFSWVDGEALSEDASAKDFEAIGGTLASLHQAGASFRWPEELETGDAMSLRLDDSAVLELSDVYDRPALDLFREAGEQISSSLDLLSSASVSWGVVHGDLRRKNIVLGEDGPHFMGFDLCRRGPLIYDLAVLWRDLAMRPNADELRAGLLGGYASMRPIPARVEWHLDRLGMLAMIDSIRRVVGSPRLRYAEWAPRFLRRGLRAIEEFVDDVAPDAGG